MQYFFSFLLATMLGVTSFAQNGNTDSLKALLPNVDNVEKIKVLLELCWQYRFINADTARQFGLKALEMSKDAHLEAIEAEALTYVGIIHEAQGNYPEALTYELKALALRRKIGDNRMDSL